MNRLGSSCFVFALVASWSVSALADDSEPSRASEPPRPVTITYTMPQPSTTTAAQATDTPATPAPAVKEGRPRYDLVRIGLGPRFDYIPSTGFDSFADTNLLSSFAIDGTYPIFTQGKLAVGVGLGWTVGHRGDSLRGMSTSLTAHRLQVPIEGRFHIVPSVYAFAKVAPGAAAMVASVTEASSPNTLRDTGWAFSADASVGAGILLGPRSVAAEGGTGPNADREKRTVRIWAIPEVGYGFTTKANLDLRPDRESKDALGTDERTAVSPLGLTAFFWRVSIATTF